MGGQDAPIIEARDGSFSYPRGHQVFSHVDLTVSAGEVLTILGPNGAGKSTLLDCLAGLTPHRVPWVFVEGRPIAELSQRACAQRIGYVSQMQGVSFDYTVRDYLVMGRSSRLDMLSRPKDEDFAAVEEAIGLLQIEHLAGKSMQQMSGGKRQQVQIARVLVQEPAVMLLDEPTNHLDFGNQIKILRIVKQLAERGIGIVMTTHMPDHAIMLRGQVGILDRAGCLRVGSAEDTIDEGILRDIYQVDDLRLVYVDEVGREACLAGIP
ncbi:ABC transporter ATP-binding protein [Gordonibacter massiliensis (ex Traore et al. 2017)]|uniref:ABC transporter ATP-binding protein n=1 Tax=Gordonibacter massiliensis (ex Traore et al. 2017) TaxID=1841863 RepID=A0A842JFX2_9ACTN|nr:ABC transporter ATP-binding protein [Gordonibacter massiliensis (ex Traore et al. 2017)]MBC2888828.1 ABC transporter ATP-binding protein [Gordonibacter massiliensis (ex Traore et al. 2017)]